jgi:hypothetical protein
MTEIQSTIVWERGAAQFIDGKYAGRLRKIILGNQQVTLLRDPW